MLCGFLMLCLPETNNKPLTDHIITIPGLDDEVKVNGRSMEEEIPLHHPESWPQLEVVRKTFNHDLIFNFPKRPKNITVRVLSSIYVCLWKEGIHDNDNFIKLSYRHSYFFGYFYIFSNLYWIVLGGIIYFSKTRSVKTVLVDDEIILTKCSSNKHS